VLLGNHEQREGGLMQLKVRDVLAKTKLEKMKTLLKHQKTIMDLFLL